MTVADTPPKNPHPFRAITNKIGHGAAFCMLMILLAAMTLLPFSCSQGAGTQVAGAPAASPVPVQRQLFVMDTSVALTLYGDKADEAADRIFEMLKQVDAHMRVQNPESEIWAVNAGAGKSPVKVSADTLAVARIALDIAAFSGGAFDPTIGPIVQLWDITSENPRVPEAARIKSALPLLGWHDVVLDEAGHTIFLKRTGMVLDFGGVAKGYAAIEAARICRETGVNSGLLNMGDSSIYLLGTKPAGKNWRIGIQNPFPVDAASDVERGQMLGIVEGADMVVETSGLYQRFFIQDGKRYSHIMDPATGYPAETGLEQATVILPGDTRWADGISTTCMVLGLEKAMKLIESTPGAAAILVGSDHKIHLSSRAAKLFTLKAKGFELVQAGS